ncbi:MAG TPA: NAD(P)H-dependent oxidoreductase [Ruminiclostridium sp.]|nr:NAD(P)H-dependent oxidoreductase [Ruminiclostridium sp.]
MQNFIETIEGKMPVFRNFDPISYSPVQYTPGVTSAEIDTAGKKVVVITDSSESSNLKNMVKKFTGSFTSNVELVSIKEFGIKGSCLGCMKCGYNYTCAYDGKDNYSSVYNSKLKTADIIVFAGSIKYRYLSSEWKQFLDRGFFNTHTPSLTGKQFGFIISGALNQNQNMRQVLEAFVQWQRSNLAGFVTDEYSSCMEIDKRLEVLGTRLVNSSIKDYIKPANFLGIGGMTIFRDNIWGDIRFPFVADHKAYKKLKVYDFPQKNIRVRLTNAIMSVMIKIPSVRKEIYNNQIIPSMTKSLEKYAEYPERFQ